MWGGPFGLPLRPKSPRSLDEPPCRPADTRGTRPEPEKWGLRAMGERPRSLDHETMNDRMEGTCPVCHQGDLISISMSVSGSDLAFTTCHMCEAKWWYRDGEAVPLQNVIGKVLAQKV